MKLSSTREKEIIKRLMLFVSNTWKCFVRPGVADTDTFLFPRIVLMVELLPTLG